MVYFTNAVRQLPVTVQVVAQQLSKIGIKLELDGVPISDTNPYSGGWELLMNWNGDYDNSATFLQNLYVSNGWQVPQGFDDPALTAVGKEIAVASPNQLPDLIKRANQLFAQYMPDINLTGLTYLGATSLPTSVLTNTGAAYFDIG
jgi:ABC-type transport system substrate-binding protein